jgi:hypothetical protein
MASKRISEFPSTASIQSSDIFLMNHLGTTSTVSFSTVSNTISQTVSSSITNSLTGDTVIQKLSTNFIKKPDSASSGQVLTYNGSTSTWVASAVPSSSLSIAGTVVILQDQKASNTTGGTPVLSTWQKRDLNTEVSDAANLCTLANSQFTLVAGTYLINASAPCYAGNSHQIRLQNTTDASTTCLGTTEFCWAGSTSQVQTRSHINDIFTITSSKTFELQHYIQAASTHGLGYPHALGTEIFTTVQLIRLG